MEALDYDFVGHFGTPGDSLAARAAAIDRTIINWLGLHPDGLVISLGEGPETQARRVDNGRMHWLSVDLPEAIRLREAFLPPTERFRHLTMSVLNPDWMAMVDSVGPVFIMASSPMRLAVCWVGWRHACRAPSWYSIPFLPGCRG
jgi:O-methyltransferase involved in polyketide biosynthesis